MAQSGRYLDHAGSSMHEGTLAFWGEWEAECEVLRRLETQTQPRRLLRPYWTGRAESRELLNTDPMVFGSRFIYSNCYQRARPSIDRLVHGSVIAFGSKRPNRLEFVLDNVFVVASSRPLTWEQIEAQYGDDPLLLETVFLPLFASRRNREMPFTIYSGATPDAPVGGMFSFVSAMPWFSPRDEGFARPAVASPYINASHWRGPSRRQPESVHAAWEDLVEATLGAGLVLGTHLAEPARRRAYT